MSTQAEDVTPSEFVAAVAEYYEGLDEPLRTELITSKAMEQVVQEWLNSDMDDAIKMMSALFQTLEVFRQGGSGALISAKKREKLIVDWKDRKQQAIQKIREAAELLQCRQPVDLRMPYAIRHAKGGRLTVNMKDLGLEILKWSKNPVPAKKTSKFLKLDLRDSGKLQWLADMGHLDIILTGMADALESVKVGPLVTLFPPAIHTESIGRRGRAADSNSAANGAAVKEIQRCLPVSLNDDYALISKLTLHAGVDVSRQNVRGILLRGRT